jgi:hypothetical protein
MWSTKGLITAVLAAGLAVTVNASSISITPTVGSDITGTVIVDLSSDTIVGFDVRANFGGVPGTAAVVDVSDPGPVGSVNLTDLSASVPNSTLTAFNSSFTEAGILTLDGLTGAFVGGTDYLVLSTGSPSTPITDPALADVLAPLVFDFSILSGTAIPGTTDVGFTLGLAVVLLIGITWRRRIVAR